MNINRRNFLKGTAAGAAATAVTGGVLIGGARADADAATTAGPVTEASYPFHGARQSGVLTPGPRRSRRSPASRRSTRWRRARPSWPT